MRRGSKRLVILVMSYSAGGQRKRLRDVRGFTGRSSKKAKTVATKVSRLQRQVALLRPELKYLYTGVTSVNVTQAAGVIFPLSAIAAGTGQDERVGSEIRGVQLSWINSYTRGSLSAGQHYRLFVIKDKENNGSAPTVTGSSTAVLETSNPVTAFMQNSARDRFVCLYDHIVTVEATNEYKENNDVQRGVLRFNMPIRFTGTGSSSASQGKNSLWFIIIASGADTGDFNTYWEFKFTDV